jgi:large subunit ribosomal protein L9
MRVVFLEDVQGVAQGGDVKDVKNGFARNYLIPQSLATPATREALQRTERLGREAETKRLKTLADMKELSEELNGAQVVVEMRAGASGRLYGSVTNMIVADEVAKLTDREIDRRTVQIPEPIRQVGVYEIRIKLHSEVETDISVLVHPAGTDPEEFLASLSEEEEGDTEAADGAAETDTEAEATEPVAEAEPEVEAEPESEPEAAPEDAEESDDADETSEDDAEPAAEAEPEADGKSDDS